MLYFKTDNFTYDKEDKTFVEESSILNLPRQFWNSLHIIPAETSVHLTNPKTGKSQIFEYYHTDMMNDEEAGGWNYKSKEDIKLLIIND